MLGCIVLIAIQNHLCEQTNAQNSQNLFRLIYKTLFKQIPAFTERKFPQINRKKLINLFDKSINYLQLFLFISSTFNRA